MQFNSIKSIVVFSVKLVISLVLQNLDSFNIDNVVNCKRVIAETNYTVTDSTAGTIIALFLSL